MNLTESSIKVRNRFFRSCSRILSRKSFTMHNHSPLVSFTFDDFPKSAYLSGDQLLKNYGFTATYYVSLLKLGNESPSGILAGLEEIKAALAGGHEIGCHTYSHCDAWETKPSFFESSIIENQKRLNVILPGTSFKTFAYPFGNVTARTKKIVSKYFVCARGVDRGQTFNKGKIDLNNLEAFFLNKRNGEDIKIIKHIIDMNYSHCGWLIFCTHDISNTPSPYGCSHDFFEMIVDYAASSGTIVLPVIKAFQALYQGMV